MSKLRTKGRFATSLELVESILNDYHLTEASMNDIAKSCKVSPTTVSKIIDGKFHLELNSIYGDFINTKIFWHKKERKCCGYVNDIMRDIDWIKRHYRK